MIRTVQEFEAAGVSGMSIEDIAVPLAFGQSEDEHRLIRVDEMVGKLRAALAARTDPSLVIAARTAALKHEGIESVVVRAKAYAAAGVDAIWMVTLGNLEELQAIHDVAKLPIIVGTDHAALTREELAAHGARVMLQGHLPIRAAAKALREAYEHLALGGTPDDLNGIVAGSDEMDRWLHVERYRQSLGDYLR